MERVIENNKLIAEFMGLGYEETIESQKQEMYDLGYMTPEVIESNYQLYHNSWDWLMPVLDKIDSLGYFVHIKSTLNRSYCLIYCDASREEFAEVYTEEPNCKFQTIYETVVEFIERYNELLSTDKTKTV